MQVHRILLAGSTKMIEAELVIVFSEEAGTPVVAPLDEVKGNCRKLEPGSSRHGGSVLSFQ